MKKYYPQLFILSFSLLASSCTVANTKSQQCAQIHKQVQQAYAQKNLPNLKRLQYQTRGSSCFSGHKIYAERQLAALMYANFVKNKRSDQQLVQNMHQILRINRSFWPALEIIADYYHEGHNDVKAMSFYSRAIEALKDDNKTPNADLPPSIYLEKLVQKAELAQLAAETTAPDSMRGSGDGAMSFPFRSMRGIPKQVPIHFNSGRKTIVGKDKYYAERLYRSLHKRKDSEPNITIIGHTDPVGGSAMNLRLSKERAATVRRFLLDKDYKGRISIGGRGESKPLFDPRGNPIRHYGKKRWYRMLRRVEVTIK
ncbi:MAG: OmpA family protein [Cocleimonas sp.]|nr:OmpA family protein [Cocleimonas sp.]